MKKLFIILMVLVFAMGFVACSDDDTTGSTGSAVTYPTVTEPAAGNLKIAMWMNGMTPIPATNVVYVIGGFGGFTNATTGGPMDSWGAGTVFVSNEMVKVSDTLYTIEMTAPSNTFSGALDWKFMNNEGTIEDEGAFDWNNLGGQLTGTANNQVIVVSNKFTLYNAPNGMSGVNTQISTNGNVIIVDLASIGGWSVDTSLTTAVDIALTINWTSVPSSHTKGGTWADLSDGDAVITGGMSWGHTNATPTTWAPTQGKPVTVPGDGTATISVTVPSGSPCSFEFKMANINGWDSGEELNNQAGFLNPDLATQTITVTFSE